uniref:Uncharacterized protein n=1 Tax=Anguilla anguilla TaxID=7936 RepID=A0A0E9SHB1_ANGAN
MFQTSVVLLKYFALMITATNLGMTAVIQYYHQ